MGTFGDSIGLPWVHAGVQCDKCSVSPINGYRYQCTRRPNYDLCAMCYRREEADPNYSDFVKLERHPTSRPYQIHLIECGECGAAPIRGKRYHHKIREDYDLCEGCYARAQTRSDRTEDYELIEKLMVKSICKKYEEVYNFNTKCADCMGIPIRGPRFMSLKNSDHNLCAFCHDENLQNGSVKSGDFIMSETSEVSPHVFHLKILCCLHCGMSPIRGPAFQKTKNPARTVCLICHHNVPEEKQRSYTRVEPPQVRKVMAVDQYPKLSEKISTAFIGSGRTNSAPHHSTDSNRGADVSGGSHVWKSNSTRHTMAPPVSFNVNTPPPAPLYNSWESSRQQESTREASTGVPGAPSSAMGRSSQDRLKQTAPRNLQQSYPVHGPPTQSRSLPPTSHGSNPTAPQQTSSNPPFAAPGPQQPQYSYPPHQPVPGYHQPQPPHHHLQKQTAAPENYQTQPQYPPRPTVPGHFNQDSYPPNPQQAPQGYHYPPPSSHEGSSHQQYPPSAHSYQGLPQHQQPHFDTVYQAQGYHQPPPPGNAPPPYLHAVGQPPPYYMPGAPPNYSAAASFNAHAQQNSAVLAAMHLENQRQQAEMRNTIHENKHKGVDYSSLIGNAADLASIMSGSGGGVGGDSVPGLTSGSKVIKGLARIVSLGLI